MASPIQGKSGDGFNIYHAKDIKEKGVEYVNRKGGLVVGVKVGADKIRSFASKGNRLVLTALAKLCPEGIRVYEKGNTKDKSILANRMVNIFINGEQRMVNVESLRKMAEVALNSLGQQDTLKMKNPLLMLTNKDEKSIKSYLEIINKAAEKADPEGHTYLSLEDDWPKRSLWDEIKDNPAIQDKELPSPDEAAQAIQVETETFLSHFISDPISEHPEIEDPELPPTVDQAVRQHKAETVKMNIDLFIQCYSANSVNPDEDIEKSIRESATELSDTSREIKRIKGKKYPAVKKSRNPSQEEIKKQEITLAEKEELLAKISAKLSLLLNSKTARDLLNQYQPVEMITINEKKFYLSSILTSESRSSTKKIRNHALLFSLNSDGLPIVRILYKSKSGGDWRVSPYIRNNFVYSKGNSDHYTQETKLNQEILNCLTQLEQLNKTTSTDSQEVLENFQPKELDSALDFRHAYLLERGMQQNFTDEVNQFELSVTAGKDFEYIQNCSPAGEFFCGSSVSGDGVTQMNLDLDNFPNKINESLRKLDKFVPDFTQQTQISTYNFTHSMLNEVKVDVYDGTLDGQTFQWHMASDNQGRIWVDKISIKDTPISSYGTYCKYLNSGVLTCKPLEYRTQCWKLRDSEKKDFTHSDNTGLDRYFDITPFIEQMDFIKQYRQVKNIKTPDNR